MTTEQQIKALAELDGWNAIGLERDNKYWVQMPLTIFFKLGTEEQQRQSRCILPDYLTSYDAIIPLIQKQFGSGDYLSKGNFFQSLRCVMEKIYQNPFHDYWHIFNICLMCSPSQLCEALLRATGKWIE